MRLGELRHRITFEKEDKTPDGYKGSVVTWQPVCVVWASVKPLSGREYFYGQQISAEITHRIKIRYNDKVDSDLRINFEGRYLEISSILNIDERDEIQEILCKESKKE